MTQPNSTPNTHQDHDLELGIRAAKWAGRKLCSTFAILMVLVILRFESPWAYALISNVFPTAQVHSPIPSPTPSLKGQLSPIENTFTSEGLPCVRITVTDPD